VVSFPAGCLQAESEVCGNGGVCPPGLRCANTGDSKICILLSCGNGTLDPGEACDDGNTRSGDGCPADCTPPCGDGVLDPGEACDDGNTLDGDGCSADCRTLDSIFSVSPPMVQFTATEGKTLPEGITVTVHLSYRGDAVLVGYAPGVPQPTWLSFATGPSTENTADFALHVLDTSVVGQRSTSMRFVISHLNSTGLDTFDLPIAYNVEALRPAIEVVTTGAGSGSITATIEGTPCDATCLRNLEIGTLVHFTATAGPGSWFHGWLTGCDGRHACDIVATVDATITGDFANEPNRVFVSSTTHDGNFGGLAGGNAICQNLAMEAGLAGTYRILLTTTTTDWTTQIAGARGWIRVDDEPVGDTQLVGDTGLYNIRLDEHGRDVGFSRYWTMPATSLIGGTYCTNWTSNVGGSGPNQQAEYDFTTRAALINQSLAPGVDAASGVDPCNV